MFSTTVTTPRVDPVHNVTLVHIACGMDSAMNSGPIETYAQSTGTTTTTTLLYS